MPRVKIPGFNGGSYKLDSLDVDAQRRLNLYPEQDESGAGREGEQFHMVGTPGLLYETVAPNAGAIRGMYYTSKAELLIVAGTKIYSLSSSYAWTELKQGGGAGATGGTIVLGGVGRVYFTDDGQYAIFNDSVAETGGTPSSNRFLGRVKLDQSTVNRVRGISDLIETGSRDLAYLATVAYKDNRFIVTTPGNTGGFYFSILGPSGNAFDTSPTGTAFPALNFASAESSPDGIKRVIVNTDYIWFLGGTTTEIWAANPDSDAPFARVGGGVAEYGVTGFTEQKVGNNIVWTGSKGGTPQVWMGNTAVPQRISTNAIEQAIKGYTTSNAYANAYQDRGHFFYCLTFPTDKKTWCWDLATQLWHERSSYEYDPTTGGEEGAWRPCCLVNAYGKLLAGDTSGRIYEVDLDTYTDNTFPIPREMVVPHLSSDNYRMAISRVELIAERGVGLNGDVQGSDPQVMYAYSNDGAHTWSGWKYRSLGKIGERNARLIWNRLGQARVWTHKWRITDPVKIRLIAATADIERNLS